MAQFPKHFTLDEARALLPDLRSRFGQAHDLHRQVMKDQEQLGHLLDETRSDLGGALVNQFMRQLLDLNQSLQRIQSLGIQIKDFERGLIDFPHFRDGREVFLCWELDEDDIEFWHELDSGYAGRERL